MAWRGGARQGTARHGEARPGMARRGLAGHGWARHGKVWHGMEFHAPCYHTEKRGMAGHGKARLGWAGHGMAIRRIAGLTAGCGIMNTGKYFHRCRDCSTEWYDDSTRHPNYCPECASQREARRVLAAKEGIPKSKATLRITNLMYRYGRRIKIGS